MNLRRSVRSPALLGALLALLLQAEAGGAQTVGQPPPPSRDAIVRVFSEQEAHSGSVASNEYGIASSSSTVIGYFDLFPTESTVSYSSDTSNGSRWTTSSGGAYLYAELRGIPHGAVITEVDFYFIDNDPTANFQGVLGYYYATSNGSGTPSGGSSLVALSSSGAPGEGVLSVPTQITYLETFDANGDGVPDTVHWWVAAGLPSSSTRVKMIRVLWRRQVSPAPSVATFGDVPTNHPFFQYIEALKAAGITSGCQADPPKYCPDNALTRGQVAKLLAIALGLQWP